VVGHWPALVLAGAHVISLGVLLTPWTRPITLAGTILHVTHLLWPRIIVPWKYKKGKGFGELQEKTNLGIFWLSYKTSHLNINYNRKLGYYVPLCEHAACFQLCVAYHSSLTKHSLSAVIAPHAVGITSQCSERYQQY
jgi:hypothetical protein